MSSQPSALPVSRLLRIATWNIQMGYRLDAVLDTVGGHADFRGLDLLCLQEASWHGGRPDAQVIAQVMGDCEWFQAKVQVHGGREQANALIWRQGAFDGGGVEVIPLGAVRLEAMRRGERALLRLSPPQKQTALCAQGDGLRVYVVHLDVVGFKHRLEQWRAILEDMRSRPGVDLSLVAGDLNTFGARKMARWPQLDALAAEAGLAEVTRRIRRTHWTGQKLDAIFAKASALRGARSWTLRTKASDHRAVFADLELAPGAI